MIPQLTPEQANTITPSNNTTTTILVDDPPLSNSERVHSHPLSVSNEELDETDLSIVIEKNTETFLYYNCCILCVFSTY
jgi:hypothetical protein